MALEQLKSPPIAEVVCGFSFEALPLDPLLVGTYWNQRKQEYPKREVHPPISEAPILFHGVGPIRSWLVSNDEAFLLQIQPDRFYLNWRRRNGDYPRFSDHKGKAPGILSKALDEFAKFQTFCAQATGKKPEPSRIDLAKIDHFFAGQHWQGTNDLAAMIPWLQSFLGFSKTDAPNVAVRFSEDREGCRLIVSLDTAIAEIEGKEPVRLIKLESRLASIPVTNLAEKFIWANEQLNDVFDALIPRVERDKRFG